MKINKEKIKNEPQTPGTGNCLRMPSSLIFEQPPAQRFARPGQATRVAALRLRKPTGLCVMSAFPPAPLSFVNHGHGTRTCLNFDFELLLLLHFHYYYYLTLTFTDTLGFMPHITQPAIRPKSVALEPIIVEPREADERALWLDRQNQVSGGRSAGVGAGAAVAAKAAAARQSSGVGAERTGVQANT